MSPSPIHPLNIHDEMPGSRVTSSRIPISPTEQIPSTKVRPIEDHAVGRPPTTSCAIRAIVSDEGYPRWLAAPHVRALAVVRLRTAQARLALLGLLRHRVARLTPEIDDCALCLTPSGTAVRIGRAALIGLRTYIGLAVGVRAHCPLRRAPCTGIDPRNTSRRRHGRRRRGGRRLSDSTARRGRGRRS